MDSNLQEIFVENLKMYRKKSGYTQESLSEKLNKTMNYISKVECKMICPTIQVIEQIAKILEIKPYLLFCDEVPKNMYPQETIEIADKITELEKNKVNFLKYLLNGLDLI